LSLADKSLDRLAEADLHTLVVNQVSEGKQIEYKLLLPGESDGEKKEFLADISSFANASGGDLLYGVRESSGIPDEICGVDASNADGEIARLESMIRDGIEPRIPGVRCVSIPLENGKLVIVVRVPMSWAAPHMITYQIRNQWRFYGRSSNGKYPLDVNELRSAFLLSETAVDEIRNFRAERLEKIEAGGQSVPFTAAGAKIVLHLVPLQAFRQRVVYDVKSLRYKGLVTALAPVSAGLSFTDRLNLDGLLSYMEGKRYVQVFHNGCVEAAEACLLRDEKTTVPRDKFAGMLQRALLRYVEAQKNLGVEPPLFVMLSLLQVGGYRIGHNGDTSEHSFDRDRLVLPEVILDSLGANPESLKKLLKGILDLIANAADLEEWPSGDQMTH
jgi:hypothetical protein